VRTGAAAITLSVALRVARGWLAHSLARGTSRRIAPRLTSHLPEVAAPRRLARGAETVETWIYMRQVRSGQ
jgi:hypothetical protein